VAVAAHDQLRALVLDHREDGLAAAVTAVNLIQVAHERSVDDEYGPLGAALELGGGRVLA
jgi:hypothetical protein